MHGFATFGLSRDLKMQQETEIHAVIVKIRDQKENVYEEIIDYFEHMGTIINNTEDDFRPCALLQRGGGILS